MSDKLNKYLFYLYLKKSIYIKLQLLKLVILIMQVQKEIVCQSNVCLDLMEIQIIKVLQLFDLKCDLDNVMYMHMVKKGILGLMLLLKYFELLD